MGDNVNLLLGGEFRSHHSQWNNNHKCNLSVPLLKAECNLILRKHGNGDTWKYLRSADNFNKKGARKIDLGEGKTKFLKNNKYLIEDRNGKILSYGGQND